MNLNTQKEIRCNERELTDKESVYGLNYQCNPQYLERSFDDDIYVSDILS